MNREEKAKARKWLNVIVALFVIANYIIWDFDLIPTDKRTVTSSLFFTVAYWRLHYLTK